MHAPKRIVVPDTASYTEFIRNDNTKYEVQPDDELFRKIVNFDPIVVLVLDVTEASGSRYQKTLETLVSKL
ncbi:hypothetical protein [Paenibacillus sp. BJ-4]|uniref:hypothetical protein n=1 Tax=Paenibacillus sp. BJ-4 TaxID=2878097 RepID=UPI001CF0AF16|nr:hypothetical protein [Paenibacillus sp. BJ-4]